MINLLRFTLLKVKTLYVSIRVKAGKGHSPWMMSSGSSQIISELGAIFRFAFKGVTIEWWDWGTKDRTHADTTVTVRGYSQSTRSDFTDDNNSSRPQIVVPSSSEIELVLTD